MQTITTLRRYIHAHPNSPQSEVLRQLMRSVADGQVFPLERLYALDLEAFELAMQFLHDWRLERYYTPRKVLPSAGASAAA
jgi:hypothetical protein